MWNDRSLQGGDLTNLARHSGYQLTITKPDGTNETKTWGVIMDTTAAQFYQYTPTTTGTYSFQFYYLGLVYTWKDISAQQVWTNDTFLPALSKPIMLTVQDEAISSAKTSYPLPSEYWTRPIEGQNTDWCQISSNWLAGAQIFYNIQPDGIGHGSAHVMWTIDT